MLNRNLKHILCPPKNAVRCESKGEKAISKIGEEQLVLSSGGFTRWQSPPPAATLETYTTHNATPPVTSPCYRTRLCNFKQRLGTFNLQSFTLSEISVSHSDATEHSSVMLLCVDRFNRCTHAAEGDSSFIFMAKQFKKTARSRRGTTILRHIGYRYQSTWDDIPESLNLLYLFFVTSGRWESYLTF